MKKKAKAKQKAARRAPAKPARTKSVRKTVTKPLRTAFMRDFNKEFRNNPDPSLNWPGAANGPRTTEEFNLFSRVLFGAAAGHIPASSVEVTTTSTALHARLVAFLDGYRNAGTDPQDGWPVKNVEIVKRPGRKGIKHRTIRLWEVAVALQDLVGSVATTMRPEDGAGDPPRFPPHQSF